MNNTEEKSLQNLFETIKIIARNEIDKDKSSDSIVGKIIERVYGSDSYRISYMNTEVLASSLGGSYETGDEVYILLPNGVLAGNKFILGRTNNRTPTVIYDGDGLSDSTMRKIQDIIDSISDLSSDNLVTPSEKQNLFIQWEQIKSSYREILESNKDYNIDLKELTDSYNSLDSIFKVIFLDMSTTSPIDGERLRLLVANYLANDTKYRIIIQEEIKKELVYKVDIVSTNGTSFKNNIINTSLYVIAMKGRKTITQTIPSANIVWNKIGPSGEVIPNWQKTGKEIAIDEKDVSTKQVFRVQIKVEEAIVAQDLITIIDLNDIDNIELLVDTSLSKFQVFSPTTNKIIPNYETQSQVLTATVKRNGVDRTNLSTYTWYYNNQKIISDSRFTINANKLSIKRNLMDTEHPSMQIKCIAVFYSEENKMNLEDSVSLDFTFVKDGIKGEDGVDGEKGDKGTDGKNGTDGKSALQVDIIHPLGTIIKNKELLELKTEIKAFYGGEDVSSKLTQRKWFYQDSSIGTSSPNYDIDGGIGWSLIKAGNTLNNNLIGYLTNLMTIQGEGFNSSISIKAVAYFNEFKGVSTTTLFDMTDPLNVVILGSGIFKESGTNKYKVEVFMGNTKIDKPEEKYKIEWNIINNSTARTVSLLAENGFPKYGENISVNWQDVPDNSDISLQCDLYEK